jgi:HKD family nuclease
MILMWFSFWIQKGLKLMIMGEAYNMQSQSKAYEAIIRFAGRELRIGMVVWLEQV